MTDGRITIATLDDRERALQTVTSAFAADPFLRLMFPDDADYAEQAPAFFGTLFDKRVGGGTVWLVDDASAVAMWDGPGPTAEAELRCRRMRRPCSTSTRSRCTTCSRPPGTGISACSPPTRTMPARDSVVR